MEPKTIVVNGVETIIKPMGADYIMQDNEEEAGVVVEIECRSIAKNWPSPLHVAYYKKLIGAYGTCAILAWQGDQSWAFLFFKPIDCGFPGLLLCHTPKSEGVLKKIQETVYHAEPIPQNKLKKKVLQVSKCLSVKPSLRCKGIGSEMGRYLIDWAKNMASTELKEALHSLGVTLDGFPTSTSGKKWDLKE